MGNTSAHKQLLVVNFLILQNSLFPIATTCTHMCPTDTVLVRLQST